MALATLKGPVPLPLTIPVRVAAPVPPFGTASLLVTPLARLMSGRSTFVIARKPSEPGALVGVARNRFGDCPAVGVMAKVPELVMLAGLTVYQPGRVMPILVTVPEPLTVAQTPSARRNVPELQVPVKSPTRFENVALVIAVSPEKATMPPVLGVPVVVTVPAPAGLAQTPSPRR